jgi:hypothetical protein
MKGFVSAGHAQRFLSAFSGISPHFDQAVIVIASTPRNTAANDRPLRHLERGHWHGHSRLTDRSGDPPGRFNRAPAL